MLHHLIGASPLSTDARLCSTPWAQPPAGGRSPLSDHLRPRGLFLGERQERDHVYCFTRSRARRMSADYAQLLRDPRWQKKRLSILARDHWTCCNCCDTTKTLHVHHLTYLRHEDGTFLPPWDYADSALLTLCADCHGDKVGAKEANAELISVVRWFGATDQDVRDLATAINCADRGGAAIPWGEVIEILSQVAEIVSLEGTLAEALCLLARMRQQYEQKRLTELAAWERLNADVAAPS